MTNLHLLSFYSSCRVQSGQTTPRWEPLSHPWTDSPHTYEKQTYFSHGMGDCRKQVIFLFRSFLGLFILETNTTEKTATPKYLAWYQNNPSVWKCHTLIEKVHCTQNLWHHMWMEYNWGSHIIHHHSCWYLETTIAMIRSWMFRIVQRT